MNSWIVIGILCCLGFNGVAQEAQDSLVTANDSIPPVQKKGFFRFKADYPNPRKAAILALALPGAGQVYNKQYWKVPVVYGGMYLLVRAIDLNTKEYNRFKTALIKKTNDEPHEFTGTRYDNTNTLRIIRDGYDKNRQLSYIGLVAVYLLQSVDAYVFAHLKSFDISEDLSLQIAPQMQLDVIRQQPSPAIGLTFRVK